jgi:dTDP-4-amino-4,6-dideoxygalactose transaminase
MGPIPMNRYNSEGFSMRVPFNRPQMAGQEMVYLLQAATAGSLSGDGVFTRKCQELLERELGVPQALLTTSCTDALEMAGLLLRIEPGDEVILPSFTFVSTANAFVLLGAVPRFADVRPDTLNLDEHAIEALITPRTKAIVAVHYAGVACEMDAILAIAARHGIAVIEDNAHGLFGRYRGRPLGSLGALATQSFHETKNFTCGEGGALLINDMQYVARAHVLREKGTNRKLFFEGVVDKYTWVDRGSSFLPADLLAAFLYAQLEQREHIQAQRAHAWNFYRTRLASWAESEGIALPYVPTHCDHPSHLFHIRLPHGMSRRALIQYMQERAVDVVFHYQPLHLSKMGSQFGGVPGQCPVSERAGDNLLRLPLFAGITEEQLEWVASTLEGYRGTLRATA